MPRSECLTHNPGSWVCVVCVPFHYSPTMGAETSISRLSLNDLPSEMLVEIVSHLAPHKQKSVAACCQVNRKWYRLLQDPVLFKKVLMHGIRLDWVMTRKSISMNYVG